MVLKSSGFVNDFVIDGTKLYVANDEGSVEIFDLNKQKLVDEIFIKPTLDNLGNQITSKILSVDRLNGKTLILSTATNGYRNLWLHDGKKLKHIIDSKNKLVIKEARFIDEKNFIFGTLGYDLIRYSLNDSYKAYTTHAEESAFSDMELSYDKTLLITSSESGRVTISDIKTGKILNKLESLNVDNIYKIAYKNGNIITAGEDRRVGVYPQKGKPYYIKSNFLVYCVAISPDGKTGIYSSGEDNDLQLFDIDSGKKKDKLIGQDAIPSTIKFFDEVGVFSAGYENSIYYWHLE
jgi:WD40 repeat protein